MLRTTTVLLALVAGLPVQAEQIAILSAPHQTVALAAAPARAVAFYRAAADALDVTMVFTDAEGEVVRSRVRMKDGQRHIVTLEGEAGVPGARFTFVRDGAAIRAQAQALPERKLAASK